MTPNEKEYMDRYIYQVIRRLPKAQRDEVRMELEELISDMYTDKGSMEAVSYTHLLAYCSFCLS